MKQWVIHAWDGTDEAARELRKSIRPWHLEGASELKRNGNFVLGGAMLNEEGQMIGSTMIVQFETQEELQAWIDREPYIQKGVWQKWDVYPFTVANVP